MTCVSDADSPPRVTSASRHWALIEAFVAEQARSGHLAAETQLCELGAGDSGVVEALGAAAARLHYIGVGTLDTSVARLRPRLARLTLADQVQPCDWLLIDRLPETANLAQWLRACWSMVRRGMSFRLPALPAARPGEAQRFAMSLDEMAALLHELAGHRIRFLADYAAGEYLAFAGRGEEAVARPETLQSPLPRPIPVCRPLLPQAADLLPYLEEVDQTRHYSNYGLLNQRLEARLAERFALDKECVCTAASGTAALVGVMLAVGGRAGHERPYCAMPAYTFVATAVAAEQCGYQPLLLDIGDDWQLDPQTVLDHPLVRHIGMVLTVAPYGRPVEQARWQDFQRASGVPVVIDGAAAFEFLEADPARYSGEIPVTLSLHATKALACGEGGAVVCRNTAVIARTVQTLNFGFRLTREARTPGSNGKLSEYHAAVGLAELDRWAAKKLSFAAVAGDYRRYAGPALTAALRLPPLIASNYVLLQLATPQQAQAVQLALAQARIDTRLWYGGGLHRQAYYARCPHGELAHTDALAPCLLGLPMSIDQAAADTQRISALIDGLLG